VGAGDEVLPVRSRDRRAQHFPLLQRRQAHVLRHRRLELLRGVFGSSQVRVGQFPPAVARDDFSVAHVERVLPDVPPARRNPDEQVARGAAALPDGGEGGGRGPAAGGDAVVGHGRRVGHQQPHPVRRHPQLLGRRLRQFRPRALAALDLSGHHGDDAVAADVDAGGDVPRPAPAPSAPAAPAAAALLRQERPGADGDQQPRPEHLHEPAAAEAEVEPDEFHRLVRDVLVHRLDRDGSLVHRPPPFAPATASAARFTASTIRGYPQHRHTCRFIHAPISSSVGFGFSSSSATAAITIPGVQ
jgi:hypothetical protein